MFILTYCNSSHHWRPHSPLSGCTCWSWWCSLHLGTGIDRLSTVWLTNTRGSALIGPASEDVIDCRQKELLKCKHSTHCYRRFHQSCLHSRPAHCTRNYGPHSARSHTACSLSCTHGWLRTRFKEKMQTQLNQADNKSVAAAVSFTHHSKTVSRQTCPCSWPCHRKSGCSSRSHHFHIQTHQCCCM